MSARFHQRPRRGHKRDHYNKYLRDRGRYNYSIIEALKSGPCVDCKRCYLPCVMDFDHVRGDKKYHVGRMAYSTKSLVTIMDEIAKCDLVCANCHRVRTFVRKTIAAATAEKG